MSDFEKSNFYLGYDAIFLIDVSERLFIDCVTIDKNKRRTFFSKSMHIL